MSEIYVEASAESISTLDEPVLETLKRDAIAIGRKMLVVVCPPLSRGQELRDWDLWGPLLLSLILAVVLASTAGEDQGGLIFSAVFVLVFVGSGVVSLNAKLLGSTISFMQTVCVMGYCLAPTCIGAIIALIVPIFWVNLIVSVVVWSWACWAALHFFKGTSKSEREALVIYPVALFYFFMTWMVVVGV